MQDITIPRNSTVKKVLSLQVKISWIYSSLSDVILDRLIF